MNDHWTTITGVVTPGHQVASGRAKNSPYPRGTIEMQLPFFKERGLDLTNFFQGTLNISIHPYTFSMRSPEYTFRKVNWTTEHPPEDFSFSRCQVIVENTEYEGWVYYPHPETKKRNFQDPTIIEVIAHQIPTIGYGDKIELRVNPKEISLVAGC
jgi:hypothetical protein